MNPQVTPPGKSDSSIREKGSTEKQIIGLGGLILGLIGAVPVLTTFPNQSTKFVGVLACVFTVTVAVRAARSKDQGNLTKGMLTWLAFFGVSMWALVVMLAGIPVTEPASADEPNSPKPQSNGTNGATTSNQDTNTSIPGSSESQTEAGHSSSTPVGSGKRYLADMAKIDTEEIDSPWISKSTQVASVNYSKSLLAEPDWCYGTQVEYLLSSKYGNFTTHVGLADDSASTTPLDFYILADGEKIRDIQDVEYAKPRLVELSVAGVSRLTIGVERENDCPKETAVWIDPVLTVVV